MATSIEHSLPTELVLEDQSQFGVHRPGNIITKSETGLRRSRSYGEHNLATYQLRFTPKSYTSEVYEMLFALMHASAVSAIPFWVKEPISKPRTDVPGELTDGVRTTFINPLDIATPDIFIGDAIDQTSPTHHAASNLLSDMQANAADGVINSTPPGGLNNHGTCTLEVARNPVLDGQYSIRVNPTGTQANVGAKNDDTRRTPSMIAGGQEYTAMASFLVTNAAHTYRVEMEFYDGATPEGSQYTEAQGEVGEWLHLRVDDTTNASTDTCEVKAYRTTSSSDSFIVACLGLAPGDFSRWFLPSKALRLVEWAAALTANKRLTFSAASCERWARVALDRTAMSAMMERLGDTTPQRMALQEALFLS